MFYDHFSKIRKWARGLFNFRPSRLAHDRNRGITTGPGRVVPSPSMAKIIALIQRTYSDSQVCATEKGNNKISPFLKMTLQSNCSCETILLYKIEFSDLQSWYGEPLYPIGIKGLCPRVRILISNSLIRSVPS